MISQKKTTKKVTRDTMNGLMIVMFMYLGDRYALVAKSSVQ